MVTSIPSINIFLNTVWLLLSVAVSYRYFGLWSREETAAKWLMLGIAFASLGLALSRLYWTPWYIIQSMGGDPGAYYAMLREHFSIQVILTTAMLCQIFGLMLHLHISFERTIHYVRFAKTALVISGISALFVVFLHVFSIDGMN